ncbi:MAG: DUF6159 family protein [archaeon]
MGITETFTRSWEITKESFKVIKADKEILMFPVLASIFSVIFFVIMALPLVVTSIMQNLGLDKLGALAYYILIFLFYMGTAFIATFFNVAVVYCAKKRFEGGDPTFKEGLSEAFKRIHLIFLWSIVSAVVGLILNMIENAAQKSKNSITRIILSITTSILGAAWGIVSIFVVPAMVFDNVGPFAALKKSAHAIKKTWGESLARHYGLGFVEAAFMVLGIIVLIPGIYLLGIFWPVGLALIAIAVIYMVIIALVFSTANAIFNTALYMYAEGKHQKAFSAETMKNAFEKVKN